MHCKLRYSDAVMTLQKKTKKELQFRAKPFLYLGGRIFQSWGFE